MIDLGSYKFINITHCQTYENPETSYSGLFWIISDYAIIYQYQTEMAIMWGIIGGSVGLLAMAICIFLYVRGKKEEKRAKYI